MEDLVTVTAADEGKKRTATSLARNVIGLNETVRPRRARVICDDHFDSRTLGASCTGAPSACAPGQYDQSRYARLPVK